MFRVINVAQVPRSPIAPTPLGQAENFAAQTSEAQVSQRIDPQRIDSQRIDPQQIDSQQIDPQQIDSQHIAQVIPTPGTANTRVSTDFSGTTFQITGGSQAGANLFHRFDQLDLSAEQVAEFQSHPVTQAIFSQVGGGPSSIDGTLRVSGSGADLYVINPAGILLGPNARLDLSGSFVVTTADRLQVGDQWIDLLEAGITAQTAVAGSLETLEFSAHAAGGAIANQGQLAVAEGESLGLLGNAVINTGSLTAPGGEVTVLSASGGQQVSLGGGLLNMALANSGVGETSEHRLAPVVAQPVAEATGLSLNADGSISLQAGQTVVAGEVNVASAQGAGGQAKLLGDDVQLTNSVVDASGAAGGEILVGGDYQGQGDVLRAVTTRLDEASTLRADGIASTSEIRPEGGEVVVWSDGRTEFAGTATARSLSPGGDGGRVETSGQQQLVVAPTANVSTTSLEGATGQWLLDPTDLKVVATGGTAAIAGGSNSPTGASTIDKATLEAGLDGNHVNLQATNSILVEAPIDTTANTAAGDLQLTAPTLNLDERIQLNGNLSGTATTVNVGANGSVRNGVDAVAIGGTVNLAAATYREGQSIVLEKSLTLQGEGIGNTILSGDDDGDGSGNHRVIQARGAGNNIVLQQLTIADGGSNGFGGGLTTNDGNLAIADVAFLNNQSRSTRRDGGAIHQSGGAVTITRSQFSNNQSDHDGGAIDLQAGSLQISDSTFFQNVALSEGGAIDVDQNGQLSITNSTFSTGSAIRGGAIMIDRNVGALSITDSDFIENIADSGGALMIDRNAGTISITGGEFLDNEADSGGAIFNEGTTTIDGTLFELNDATVGQGGAIHSLNGSLSLENAVLQTNTANLGGGGISLAGNSGTASIRSTTVDGNTSLSGAGGGLSHVGGQTTTITDSTFSFNVALGAENGGAINLSPAALGTTIQVENSTLSGNRSGNSGGGLFQASTAQTTLNNVTVADNTADTGGGLANLFGGSLTVQNSIVAGNSATANPDVTGPITSLGNNIVQNRGTSTGYVGTDLPDGTDPLLLSLVENGGPTQTHAVSVNSLAVDGGNTDATTADQRGLVAVNNQRDIGAYELDNDLTFAVTGSGQTQTVNQAFASPVGVTVTDSLGGAIAGLDIAATAPGAGASTSLGTLQTDSSGIAATTATANTVAGSYTVNLGITGNSSIGTVALNNRPDSPDQLALLNGNNQSTVVNTSFADPLQVSVTDQYGNAIPGATINVNRPISGASAAVGDVSLTTNSAGQATTAIAANTMAGNYSVDLTSGSLSSSAMLTNRPDVPNQLTIDDGNNQSTVVNTAFPDALRVQVLDQFGNAIPHAIVSFSALTATRGAAASAELSTESITTDGGGQGQTLATANEQVGAYQVLAQAGDATGAFQLENLSAPLALLSELPTPTEPPRPLPPLADLGELLSPAEPSRPSPPLAEPSELPSPAELPRPSPPVEPGESPSGLTSPDPPLNLVNTKVIDAIDSSLSAEYTDHWGTSGESQGMTVSETREVLQNAEEAHGVKSAVVYGLFVPQDQAADESFGPTQVASMALSRRAQSEEQNDDDLFMLVLVPNEGPMVQQFVNVTRKEMLQQVQLFRMAVSDPDDELSYKPLARQLYRWILEPVEPELERLELDNIMYVMDAGLRALPLAAMMKGDEFAIERYGISLIPSVDLLETNFGSLPPAPQTLAAGADEFEQLSDLPAVEVELQTIVNRRKSVDVLFNQDFTREKLVALQKESQASMIHIATHAEFNAGDLDNSYLQFWDQRLTLDDMSKLGWDELELLILSACQTALSSPEAELGFAGLAAATGVESSIGSLWHVSDIGTLGLMSEFYGQLSQEPLRFEALRQAQISMLRGETRVEQQQLQTNRGDIPLPAEWELPESADFSHPFYWSGFTLVGNPWW